MREGEGEGLCEREGGRVRVKGVMSESERGDRDRGLM